MISGIYKIKNIKNNKVYIGSSIDIINRWYDHKTRLNKKRHHSIKLQRAFNKYGKECFIYDIIEECESDYLIIKEQYYIDLFDSYKNGYNSVPNAKNNLGMIHSDETKEKIRDASKGNKNMLNKKHTDETKNLISEKLKGTILSENTKLKMSETRKGKIMSEETKNKMSESKKGKIMSEETKNKIRLSHLGKTQSKETIEKRVKSNSGKIRTKECKNKISEKLKGIKRCPMSLEHKLKISKSRSKK